MTPTIRPYVAADRDAVVALSLRAWAPVFPSIKDAMGADIYDLHYPAGWEASQRADVGHVLDSDAIQVWVAVADAAPTIAGFVAAQLHDAERGMGEIYMLAVDPSHQRQGIATDLIDVAMRWLTDNGMTTAMIETGGDPGHAPARATYEAAGFSLLPVSRYFKLL
jgi:GNAT superfamily N-acetyltransferase